MDIPGFLIPAAQAHEKWFVPVEPVRYAVPEFFRTANPVTIGALAAVVVLVVAGLLADRWFERSRLYARLEERIRPYRDYAAGVLAVTTGVLLLWSAWNGVLIADNFPLSAVPFASFFRVAEATVGGLLLIGLFTPEAAVGLLALYGTLFLAFPPLEPLDYLYFPAIAVLLFFFSRGRFSLDWFLGKPIFSTPAMRKHAYLAMRVITGAGFVILALGKFFRPDLHLSLMDRFPDFNPYVILRWIGIALSRETYVFALFTIEFTVGVFVAAGFLTRIAAVMLVPVFTGSILFLGGPELIGHLPVLGILFVLFVYGDTYHKGAADDRYAEKSDTAAK